MRLTTSSGPLTALLKLLTTFLLFHLLAGHSSAYPFTSSDLTARQSLGHSNAHQLDVRTLRKRSNCQPGDNPDLYNCDGEVTGVDEVKEKVDEWGVIGRVPSVFYTGHPIGLAAARQWASCFFTDEAEQPTRDNYIYAIWQRLTDPKWLFSESFWIQENQPDDVSDEDNKYYADMLLKHLAQAFAEASSGDVYLVVGDDTTPDDKSWNTDAAWGGWEWPALTRNSNVERILRVDPNQAVEPREIWTSSDGPQGDDPKGIRESTPQTPRS